MESSDSGETDCVDDNANNEINIVRTYTLKYFDIGENDFIIVQTCDQNITLTNDNCCVAPIISCPANANLECDESTDPANTGTATSTEGCGDVTITYNDVVTPGDCVGFYTITRTWTATDENQDTATCDQIITVSDTTVPVLDDPAPIEDISCNDQLPAQETLSATDNCSSVTVTPYVDQYTVDVCNGYTITYIWTAVDACGNSSEKTVSFNVLPDTTPPTISGVGADGTFECGTSPTFSTPTASDTCDSNVTLTSVDTEGATTCAGTALVRTWTATDDCGNTATASQTMTPVDTTAPVAPSVPADLNLECADDVPAPVSLTATDNCDGDITVSPTTNITPGACVNDFTMVRTWTFTDACGNTSSVSQTITVLDDIAPSITAPAGGVIACDADPIFSSPTYSDNCNGVTITSVDSETGNSCGGSYTRTWTATDACGNTASASQTFTYADTQAPVITCPADTSVEFGGDTSPASTGTATATDNCSTVTITFADSSDPGCGNTEVITRTWTATDACGNQSSCVQTINVTDTTPPEVTCPTDPNLLACATEDEIEAAYNAWVAGFSATGPNVTSNIADIPALTAYVCGGGINLSFTLEATDGCTPVDCSSTFTVAAAPALELVGSCPGDPNLDGCSTDFEIEAAWTTWIQGLQAISATGGCTAEVEYSTPLDQLIKPKQCSTLEQQISVSINAKDDCGETSPITCTFTVAAYANDLQVSDIQSTSVEACDYANQGELNTAFDNWLSGFGVKGGCDPQASGLEGLTAPDLCSGGSVSVTYTVTDLCQNGEDTATFTVNASAPIEVGCPAPVALGSSLTEQEILDAYNTWKAGFWVVNGCNTTNNLADFPSLPNYDCGTGVDLSFTLNATDRCGANSCSSTFTVEGIVGLSVDCPAPVSLDACATQDEIEAAYNTWAAGFAVNDGDNPTSNIADIPTLDAFACGGAVDLSFTLTAIDDCNPNGVSCGSTFTVAAAEELVVVCSSPVVLNSPVTSQEIQDAYNAWVAGFSVSGGCDASSNINSIPTLPDYVCGQAIDLSFVLEATDDCGTKSCSSSFYVEPTDSVEAGEGGSLVICEGDTVTAEDLYAQLTGADAGGVWSPIPSGAGTYTYTVYGTDPCPNDTATVEVTEQIIEISVDELVCGEQSDYGFYTADVTTNGGTVTSDYGTPNNNGGNSWTITDIPNGQNVTVTVTTDLQCESSLEIEAPDCFCIELYYEYTNVTCYGLDDGTIIVTQVSEGATVTVNGQPYDANMLYAPGSYTIKAFYEGVDIDECIFEEKINIEEPALVNINAVGTDVTCYGANDGTITVSNLSAGATYTIKKNGLGPDLKGQAYFGPGMYIVKAFLPASDPISGGGQSRSYDPCQSIVIVNIAQPAPLACKLFTGFGAKVDCKNPENNWIAAKSVGQGQITYTWSLSPKAITNGWGIVDDTAGNMIQIIPGSGSATYYLSIQDETGCISECSIDVTSKCAIGFSPKVNLYPNPVKDILNVKFDEEIDSDVTIEVYNLVGTKMFANTFKANDKKGNTEMKVDFSKFPSHVYYVKIITKHGTVIKKVVLHK